LFCVSTLPETVQQYFSQIACSQRENVSLCNQQIVINFIADFIKILHRYVGAQAWQSTSFVSRALPETTEAVDVAWDCGRDCSPA